jgi:hypothetical protein
LTFSVTHWFPGGPDRQRNHFPPADPVEVRELRDAVPPRSARPAPDVPVDAEEARMIALDVERWGENPFELE